MKKLTILTSILMILTITQPIFADYKISQKTTMEGMSTELTVYAKGVRERREQKMVFEEEDAETAAMMGAMIPNLTTITQCDLKQDVSINEKKKAYFIDYYDWSGLSPEQKKKFPDTKMVIKGTLTTSSTVTDSGKRQTMFGLEAKWLKSVMSVVTSADSCDGKSDMRIEKEGWFVNLTLSRDVCPIPMGPESKGGCRPKLIIGTMQDPGFMLEGTTKTFENNKLSAKSDLVTTALSKATLDQSLFEVPINFTEVDSLSELMQGGGMPGMETFGMSNKGSAPGKTSTRKTVAVDFFSGNTSKIDEDELRGHISQKLTAAGFEGFVVRSKADLQSGSLANVVGVEVKKVKESGASKIGGLFGKVTGNEDGAQIGQSEAEIVVTIYGKDGKTVVASASANEKVKGKGNDAVKAGIDRVLASLLEKIR